jgi:hypothetical protein
VVAATSTTFGREVILILNFNSSGGEQRQEIIVPSLRQAGATAFIRTRGGNEARASI